MSEWIVANEPLARLVVFSSVFALMAIWEIFAARRSLRLAKGRRWLRNLSLVALNTLVVRLLFPSATVMGAMFAAERGWGLLNVVQQPGWLAIAVSVVILDFTVYVQHVVFHAVPLLWRLHMVHHADLDFDVTTGARFHPIEIVLSLLIKLAVIVALGVPALGAFVFEAVLSTTAMFNHGNVRLFRPADRVLRWVIVTPDMHRVHHSVKRAECNSNFGFNLPWWDRLLGTYQAQPEAGHEGMQIGLEHLQERRQTLPWMVALPFVGTTGGYAGGQVVRGERPASH